MTDHEFDEVLTRLSPTYRTARAHGLPRPAACSIIAADLWRTRRTEDDDTAALRHQMDALHTRGVFDFSAWHTN